MQRFATLCLAVWLCAVSVSLGQSRETMAEQKPSDAPVSEAIWNGFKRYHATCNHCHGPAGVGSSFGPSLVDATLPDEAFRQVVLEGVRNGDSVMKGFASDPNVVPHIDDIQAYLKARAEGRLGRGRPKRPE